MGASREIRALFDESTIVVYQAFSDEIVDAAIRSGTFVAPFKRERMTWIKPSFLWMMYRSGWARKEGQERILAVTIARSGFEWALEHAVLTHYDASTYPSREDWSQRLRNSCVRVQWDPERSLTLEALPHRAIQIGLSGEAVARYVDDWIERIEDVTPNARNIDWLIREGQIAEAQAMVPVEREYPVPERLAGAIGLTPIVPL